MSISLEDLGKLSEAAKMFVEKISEAIGGVFKPFQIVRVAKAEAEADRIRANSEIDVQDIHRRAMHRFFEEEAIKQKNIEDIIQKALPDLNDDAKSENIENDWIVNFFDKCRLISDIEMQELWSRVLSGEANSPGSYSKRTVNFLSSLDKRDAELFSQVCKFVWQIRNTVMPLIFSIQQNIYKEHGIRYDNLNHLESIGLIRFDNITSFHLKHMPKRISVKYFGQEVLLSLKKELDNDLDVGRVMLTRVGQELAPICGSLPAKDFFKLVYDKWKNEGLIEAKA